MSELGFIAGTDIKEGEVLKVGEDGRLYPLCRLFPLANGDTLTIFEGNYKIIDSRGSLVEQCHVKN